MSTRPVIFIPAGNIAVYNECYSSDSDSSSETYPRYHDAKSRDPFTSDLEDDDIEPSKTSEDTSVIDHDIRTPSIPKNNEVVAENSEPVDKVKKEIDFSEELLADEYIISPKVTDVEDYPQRLTSRVAFDVLKNDIIKEKSDSTEVNDVTDYPEELIVHVSQCAADGIKDVSTNLRHSTYDLNVIKEEIDSTKVNDVTDYLEESIGRLSEHAANEVEDLSTNLMHSIHDSISNNFRNEKTNFTEVNNVIDYPEESIERLSECAADEVEDVSTNLERLNHDSGMQTQECELTACSLRSREGHIDSAILTCQEDDTPASESLVKVREFEIKLTPVPIPITHHNDRSSSRSTGSESDKVSHEHRVRPKTKRRVEREHSLHSSTRSESDNVSFSHERLLRSTTKRRVFRRSSCSTTKKRVLGCSLCSTTESTTEPITASFFNSEEQVMRELMEKAETSTPEKDLSSASKSKNESKLPSKSKRTEDVPSSPVLGKSLTICLVDCCAPTTCSTPSKVDATTKRKVFRHSSNSPTKRRVLGCSLCSTTKSTAEPITAPFFNSEELVMRESVEKAETSTPEKDHKSASKTENESKRTQDVPSSRVLEKSLTICLVDCCAPTTCSTPSKVDDSNGSVPSGRYYVSAKRSLFPQTAEPILVKRSTRRSTYAARYDLKLDDITRSKHSRKEPVSYAMDVVDDSDDTDYVQSSCDSDRDSDNDDTDYVPSPSDSDRDSDNDDTDYVPSPSDSDRDSDNDDDDDDGTSYPNRSPSHLVNASIPNKQENTRDTKMPVTPRTRRMNVKSLTPSLPLKKNMITTPTTPKDQALKALHISSVPESLPCRKREYDTIYHFLRKKIKGLDGGFMYVYGVPGAGKTATLERVIERLEMESKTKKINKFTFIGINGMHLKQPNDAYCLIWDKLGKKSVSANKAKRLLEQKFQTIFSTKQPILLLIDEFDMLFNRTLGVVDTLFDWIDQSKLILIGIANTKDLIEEISKSSTKSRIVRERLCDVQFETYTYQQLQEIIEDRLKKNKVFTRDAVEFLARKSALSGDVRLALNLCRRVLAEAGDIEARNAIDVYTVISSLEKIREDPKLELIKSLGKEDQMILQAIRDVILSSGMPTCSLAKNLYAQYKVRCVLNDVIIRDDFSLFRNLRLLASYGIIGLSESDCTIHTEISLGNNIDFIQMAFQPQVHHQ